MDTTTFTAYTATADPIHPTSAFTKKAERRLRKIVEELKTFHRWELKVPPASIEKELLLLADEAHYFGLVRTQRSLLNAREVLRVAGVGHTAQQENVNAALVAMRHVVLAKDRIGTERNEVVGGGAL